MTITDGDILGLVIRWSLPYVVEAINTGVIQMVSGGPESDADVTADMLYYVELFQLNIEGQQSTSCVGELITVNQLNSAGEVVRLVGEATSTAVGTSAIDMLPHGVAAMVRGLTAVPRVEARRYFPGFVEAVQDEGIWSAGALTALGSAVINGFGGFSGNTSGAIYAPGVVSSKTGDFEPCSGTYVVDGLVDYQRRRKQGVGS